MTQIKAKFQLMCNVVYSTVLYIQQKFHELQHLNNNRIFFKAAVASTVHMIHTLQVLELSAAGDYYIYEYSSASIIVQYC